nr:DUF6007 family protein [Salibacterium halotolerans]
MSDLKTEFQRMGWLDLIFVIPMFLLFSYLPVYNVWSIVLNVMIISFSSFGFVMIFQMIIASVKNQGSK